MSDFPRLAAWPAALFVSWFACWAPSLHAQTVTTPEQHLGRPVGVDFELADWTEVSGYHRLLAQESPRVQVEHVGTTTEGREFLTTIISSEANLARLDEIKAISARLADPRGLAPEERAGLIRDGRVVILVSLAMHSTETAGPQFGLELVHRLATSQEEPWTSVRDECVVVVLPCTNPDGLDRVVSWYRETVGTPYEGTGLLELYQHYAGHDNNRDWFMLSLDETRIVTEQLYSVWRPQVYWDVHQQGRSRERLFVPPFRDPLNPNLDPSVMSGIDALGSRALFDLTREGFTGVSTGVTYDMWWNGGNRNVPVRHNIIGLLTEAASVNIASPVWLPLDELQPPRGLPAYAPSMRFVAPWPGGWWRLRDIIDYELGFARSLLGSLARERDQWLGNALDISVRNIAQGRQEPPRAWIIPSDNRDTAAVRRLLDTLLLGGVEVHTSPGALQADGREWPAGSVVILREQPYGDHVKDLFEVQRYPDGDPPYDVAGWTLPLLMGVHRVEVVNALDTDAVGSLQRARTPEQAVEAFPTTGQARGGDTRNGDEWRQLMRSLAAGVPTKLVTEGEDAGFFTTTRGTKSESPVTIEGMPRIGVYAPWSGSMDEGWLRWVLDRWEVPFTRVRNEMIRAGELDRILDVLIVPSVWAGQLEGGRRSGTVHPEFAGGLDPEGAVAIDAFVRGGGTLVTLGGSSSWAVDLFELPLTDTTRGDEAKNFSCPGSVLRAVPEESRFTAGLPGSMAVFFSSSAAWEVDEKAEDVPTVDVLMRYAPTRVLLSGWIRGEDAIEGKAAWVTAEVGQGRVFLFGFRPQYRSWSQGAFQLLFRSMLLR